MNPQATELQFAEIMPKWLKLETNPIDRNPPTMQQWLGSASSSPKHPLAGAARWLHPNHPPSAKHLHCSSLPRFNGIQSGHFDESKRRPPRFLGCFIDILVHVLSTWEWLPKFAEIERCSSLSLKILKIPWSLRSKTGCFWHTWRRDKWCSKGSLVPGLRIASSPHGEELLANLATCHAPSLPMDHFDMKCM